MIVYRTECRGDLNNRHRFTVRFRVPWCGAAVLRWASGWLGGCGIRGVDQLRRSHRGQGVKQVGIQPGWVPAFKLGDLFSAGPITAPDGPRAGPGVCWLIRRTARFS